MDECIFCKIAAGDIKSDIVYEDEKVIAFKDINPAAPVHLLVIPRKHVPSLLEIGEEDKELIGHIHLVLQKLARDFKIDRSGFRVINNCGKDSGQAVFHLHFHLLGGRPLPQNLGGQ
ncbi:MAG: histidine triad nucleotide-binding protein [Firmicutes bacterium]|nr:histidine triad nucleotide-binding protein [Bacillota bacterium]